MLWWRRNRQCVHLWHKSQISDASSVNGCAYLDTKVQLANIVELQDLRKPRSPEGLVPYGWLVSSQRNHKVTSESSFNVKNQRSCGWLWMWIQSMLPWDKLINPKGQLDRTHRGQSQFRPHSWVCSGLPPFERANLNKKPRDRGTTAHSVFKAPGPIQWAALAKQHFIPALRFPPVHEGAKHV